MGLDISVYKVVKNPADKKSEEFHILSECPELIQFKPLAYERVNEYWDLDKTIKDLGHNPDEMHLDGYDIETGEDITLHYTHLNGESIDIKNPPYFYKTELCIDVEEVGYQRKGANSDFYEHDIWNSDCITKLEVLEEHAKKYFDDSFRQNIIENFVEGETFVIYQ